MKSKPLFKGRLIAIGGNEDKVNDLIVLKHVIQEIEKSDFKVGIITTASQSPTQLFEQYRQIFLSLGASTIEIFNIKTREQANNRELLKNLEKVDLIYLVGGDQLRLTSILGGSQSHRVIKKCLENGAVIAGTSAGAAVLSDTMIYDGKAEEGFVKGRVLTTSGFGFVKNIVFDTHFVSRGRIGRLIQLVTTNPTIIGIGIGDDSGVILRGEGIINVIGTGEVIIVDGSDIVHSNFMEIVSGWPIAVENIRIHSLVDGYGYDLERRLFLKPKK